MILNFSWCLSPAVSCAVLNKGPVAPEAGLPSPYRKHPLNWGPAATAAGLPSPSSLRDATSPKVRGLGSPQSLQFSTLRPAAARGAVRRCAETFRLCQGLPLWERLPPAGGRCRMCDRGRTAGAKRLRGRGRGQEAVHLVWHCLAEAQPYRRHDLNLGPAPPLPTLPSPSSLRDATSPKVRGFGCTGKFAFSKKLSLWESWREAPERASPLPGPLDPSLAGACGGRGRARWRRDFASV